MAVASADYIKCGFAGLDLKAAVFLGRNLVRTVREWFPDKKVYPAVFPEEEFTISFDPLVDGPKLVEKIDCDGLLIDTYYKDIGKGLLDYYEPDQLASFVEGLHRAGKESWLAGSITDEELLGLWNTDVDVICVRAAVCSSIKGDDRFGNVESTIVAELVNTIPKGRVS